MVYNKKSFFVYMLLLAILFSGCSNSNNSQDVFCAKATKFNQLFVTNNEYIFTFPVQLLTQSKDNIIEFDSFEGKNVDNISVTLVDNYFGSETVKKYDGYYLRLLTLHCESNEDNIRIDKASFLINGEINEVIFDPPIKASRLTYDPNDYERGLFCIESTVGAPTAVLETGQKLDYLITSSCNVVVTGIEVLDYLIISDSLVMYNNTPLGKLEDVLPLEVNKNDQYRIFLSFKYDESTKANSSYYDSILTTITIKYVLPETPEKELRFDMTLSFAGLFDDQCAEEFVKLYKLD